MLVNIWEGVGAREEAERFREIFTDMGENITTLGSQAGGVADQVADWIRSRGK